MTVTVILLILMALSECHSHLPIDCTTDEANNDFNLKCFDSFNIYTTEQTLHITHNDGLMVIDLTTFPKLNISQELRSADQKFKLHAIKMENCTLKDGQSFGTLLEHFGIEDEILVFEGINISQPPLSLDGRFSNGFEKVENLTLRWNSIRQLNENVFQSMTKLINLDLSHNGIVILHPNVFNNLMELRELTLSSNELTSLSEGLFDHQKQLDVLLLQRNKLQNLSKEMFRGLDSLRVLFLQKNYIASLTDNVFHYLPNLLNIWLGKDGMRVPHTIFANQSRLKFVFLEKVKITEGLRLSGLIKLEIKSSEVMSIAGLSNIETVSIINCNVHPLAVASFENLSSTQELDLSSGNISNLVDGLFDGLTGLNTLRLSGNHLTNISGLIFRDLLNLTEIDLSGNRLTTIHPNAFVATTQLKTINLKDNQLAFSDDNIPFIHLDNLITLNLANNNLTRMPSDLGKLEKLKEIDLSSNQISTIKFNELRQNFVNISSAYETSPTLGSKDARTNLNKNPLDCDCGMFDFLLGTDQAQLAPAFNQSCRRHHANLTPCYREPYSSDECPTECTCTVRADQPGLHIFISCNGTQLRSPPKIKFINATSIELDISNNDLVELPILDSNSPVTFIQASFNQISTIKKENLPATLRGLDLSHNNVGTIAANVIRDVKKLQSFEIFLLKDNPLECRCSYGREDTEQLIEFAIEHSSITDLQGAKCNVHDDLSMEVLQKNCTKNEIIDILICVTILMSISGVILTLFVKHHEFIKMWLYAHDWFLWWVDEEYVDRYKVYDIFISYAHADRMLAYRITYALEKCNIFRVCLHEEDFITGGSIEESVRQAVQNSRRILVILSENYLESVWCEHEFHLAWYRSVAERRKLIIAVKDGKLGNIADGIIRSYVKTHTYVESGDEWFWEKLVYRLPHKKMIKNIFPIREFVPVTEEEISM